MKRIVWMSLFVAAASVALAAACSRGGHRAEHVTEEHAAEPAPPTPDTTPIPLLRTPAGLVLGVEGTPAPAEPSPEASPLVAATPMPPLP
jgi:hypothetical protein